MKTAAVSIVAAAVVAISLIPVACAICRGLAHLRVLLGS